MNPFHFIGDDIYAVAFEPTPGAVAAHHMKMFSCAPGDIFYSGKDQFFRNSLSLKVSLSD